MRHVAGKHLKNLCAAILLALALLAVAQPANAQKKDKDKNNKNKNAQLADTEADLKAAMHTPDSQAIDQAIGEALGYWQIGDAESLRKYYAEDVVSVSGAWEAPVIGRDNFLKAYQEQRAQINAARMDRSNTLIKVNGNSAWATYQFVYAAQSQGKVAQFRGHTTLFLIKQADRWLITLNHSSIVDSSFSEPAGPTEPVQPGNR
jgi:ketosteroid isomerase-like protein